MKCPRPLFEVSKAIKDIAPGEALTVRADGPAFKLDIEAWCRRTGNPLESLEKRDDGWFALVRRAG
jgi:TusA-related sulfurtransferase